MLVSKVETGLRLAIVTIVWAARWMTVSISYSPRMRSSSAWSRTSPRTTLTCSIQPGAHQLALRHPIAHQADHIRARCQPAVAPASCRPGRWRRSRMPVDPARKNDFIPISSMVHSLAAIVFQQLHIPQCIHTLPEAIVPIGRSTGHPPPAVPAALLPRGCQSPSI